MAAPDPDELVRALCAGTGAEALLVNVLRWDGGLPVAIQALPVIGTETNGFTGRITTNSGGLATAEVAAICLR